MASLVSPRALRPFNRAALKLLASACSAVGLCLSDDPGFVFVFDVHEVPVCPLLQPALRFCIAECMNSSSA